MDSVMRFSARPMSVARIGSVRLYARCRSASVGGKPICGPSAPLKRRSDANLGRTLPTSISEANLINPWSHRVLSLETVPQAATSNVITKASPASEEPTDESDLWQVKMLYDGECPLCMIEVNALRDRNKIYKTIKFVDISSPEFNPEDNAGVEFETAMGKIHCIQRDGKIFTGVSAFQKFYDVLGMGWVYSLTKIKPVGHIADALYDFWAKYRLPITGRPPLAIVLEERKKLREAADSCEEEGRCNVEF